MSDGSNAVWIAVTSQAGQHPLSSTLRRAIARMSATNYIPNPGRATMNTVRSLQDQFAPDLICFGCGPANEQGLRIKSFVRGDEVVARFEPSPHHRAFPGMINGGIIGALLDCHMNWTAAWHLMVRNGMEKPPCTVTAEYSVQFQRPTPSDQPIDLVARIVDSSDRKAVIEADVSVCGQVTATGRGTFVSVKPGHPAYHRW